MPDIALITDSGCDLPDELLERYRVGMVPLYILWGRDELRDRIDLSPQAFYQRLVTDSVHPTTSQPHPHDFSTAFQRAHDAGADAILAITISGGMSSTNHSALQAAERVDFPVHVIDSRANSLSQGWMVLAAARVRAAGGDLQAMIAAAEQVRQKLVTLLYVDTLEYLYRGGRIGRAAKWLGTVLDLKPLLCVDHQTGKIEPRTRARNRSKALNTLYDDFFAQLDTSRPLHIGLVHGNVPDEAAALADRIRREFQPVELLIGMTSPVMGVHTGPGALALCGYAGD